MLGASFETKSVDEFDDALVHETLARIAFLERNFHDAVRNADTAIGLLQRIHNEEHLLEVAMRQCAYLTLTENGESARALWQQYGRKALNSENPETCALALDARAMLYTGAGDLRSALTVRVLLQRYRLEHHLVVFPVEQRLYDAWDFAARAILGSAVYQEAITHGQAMDLASFLASAS